VPITREEFDRGITKEQEQELNKELAEWAGFKWQHAYHDFYELVTPDGAQLDLTAFRIGSYKKCPKFTQSLDACFKWLVPKLNRDGWFVELQQASMREYWKARLWCPSSGTGKITLGSIRARPIQEAETPALALCLAIEKLIDSS